MAVGDLTGDGLPEVVIADKVNSAVMVYRNTSSREGALCVEAPPVDPGPSLPPLRLRLRLRPDAIAPTRARRRSPLGPRVTTCLSVPPGGTC
jgi:hypothetical protein